MRKALLLFLLLISACHPAADLSGDRPDVLLQEVGQDLDNQRFEAAMEKGLRALEIARGSGDRLGEVKALQALVGIDIMASRDGDAWEKALEAEAIARDRGFRKELSGILVSKAKLCSYAEISPETGRNDEGLAYAREALVLAEEAEAIEQQCEACLVIGSLYINKNRWSDPIDPDIYRTAGEWLDRGQALCDSCDLPVPFPLVPAGRPQRRGNPVLRAGPVLPEGVRPSHGIRAGRPPGALVHAYGSVREGAGRA